MVYMCTASEQVTNTINTLIPKSCNEYSLHKEVYCFMEYKCLCKAFPCAPDVYFMYLQTKLLTLCHNTLLCLEEKQSQSK